MDRHDNGCRRAAAGFTLIEILIALVLVAILAGIALPGYAEHVRRAYRAEARTGLVGTAQSLERCFSLRNAYDHEDCASAFPVMTETGRYRIEAQVLEATAFTLVATPVAGFSDPECGALTIEHTGAKGVSGGSGDVPACW